jgi:hypothetical protein
MKVLLLILLLIGAAFAVPSIRNRLAGPMDPLLARLGPVGEKIRTPARRFTAHNEIQAIIGRLNEEKLQGRSLPRPVQFRQWVHDKMRGDIQDGIDPWGQPYYYSRTRTHAVVGSAGADQQRDTQDDVRISTSLK